jgi:xylan 1,4-beta-xylosidase
MRYSFADGIHGDFKTLRVERDPEAYSLSARPGWLRLRGGQSPASCYGQTLLARRQTDFRFDAETLVDFAPTSFQHLAGICWRYDEANQYLLAISHDETKGRVLSVLTFIGGEFSRTDETVLPASGPVRLGLSVRVGTGLFRYSIDGETWNELRPVLDARVLSDEYRSLGFTGAFTGIFSVDTMGYAVCADFEYFNYKVL